MPSLKGSGDKDPINSLSKFIVNAIKEGKNEGRVLETGGK